MIAIFKTGGKQYIAQQGQVLKVEKIEGKKGENYIFDQILAISDKSKDTIGNPLIKGASIKTIILDQIREKKIIVFKKRRRKNYRSTQGHRQQLTVLRIESISLNNEKNKTVASKIKSTQETKLKKKLSTKTKIIKKTTKKQINKKNITKKTLKSKK